jgi:hypothetical protein
VLEARETGARARRSDLGRQEMKPPLKMWNENWNGGTAGVDSGKRRNPSGYPTTALLRKGNPAESAECWWAV